MTTITLKLVKVSPTGAHNRIAVFEDGAARIAYDFEAETFDKPETWEERRAFVRTLIRVLKRGRTRAQVRSILEAGLDVVL